MVIKDRILEWFIRNVIVSRTEIIDKPGFVFSKFGSSKGTCLREFFLGESLIQNIETKIKNKNILYYAGKLFGYIYAYNSNLPTIKQMKKGEFERFSSIMIKYIETLYASHLSHEIDHENKSFRLLMKDYVVCRKNGLGHLFSTGGTAGIWAYVYQDNTMEAVQPKCQGRGDKECEVIVAPYSVLVKMGHTPIRNTNMEKIRFGKDYAEFNKARPVSWAKNSLKDMIDHRFFKHAHGQVTYKNERFFLCEISFMYILEKELKKIKNGLKVLWDVSFSFGKNMAGISIKQDAGKFIMGFLPALGFGDVLVMKKEGKYKVMINYFPWTKWADDIDFTIFRGILSGMISGFSGREVKLTDTRKYLSKDGFSLTLSESSSSRKTSMKNSKKKPSVS